MTKGNRLSIGEFASDLYGVVAAPSRRFSVIHERGALWGSLLLLLAPVYFAMHFAGGIYFDRDPFPAWSWLAPLAVGALLTYLKVAFIHIIARLFEGKGRYASASGRFRDMVVLYGYSSVPYLLATLVMLALFFLLTDQLAAAMRDFKAVSISILVAIGVSFFVWHLVLMVLALRHVYPMRDWKIVVAVILGPALAGGASMSLMYVAGSAKVEVDFARPIYRDKVIRIAEAEGPSTEEKPAHVEMRVDLLVYRFKAPRRSELVVFEQPEEAIAATGRRATPVPGRGKGDRKAIRVGRIVGLPGERVEASGDHILIDGRPWAEPYIAGEFRAPLTAGPVQLGPSLYLVLPEDRRLVLHGFEGWIVPREGIQGRVPMNRWPLGRFLRRPTAFLAAEPAP